MEVEHHGPLKSGSNIFKDKWNNLIRKFSPGSCESSLVLVLFLDLNLVITRKTIHERKDFVVGTCINDLVSEHSVEFLFGTCQIEVTEVSTGMNGTSFFDRNKIINPSGLCNWVYETRFTHFFNLEFDGTSL